MLSIHRMRLLREVASRGTITAAAEALYLTPSAVSQQLAVLEREAGTPLLERAGRTVRLTFAGERLVDHTERILASLEEAEADLAAVSGGVTGRLHACAFPTAARTLLVPALALLQQRYPNLELRMVDLEPEESLPMLKTGDLDLVVIYGFDRLPEPALPGIEYRRLLVEPMYLALSTSHPLASGPVGIADLAGERWLVGRDGSPFHEVMERVCNEAGYEPRLELHSNDFQVILASVEAGLGVALVPPLAFFAEYPGVVYRLPSDITINRSVRAAIRSGSANRPTLSAALAALTSVADEVSGIIASARR